MDELETSRDSPSSRDRSTLGFIPEQDIDREEGRPDNQATVHAPNAKGRADKASGGNNKVEVQLEQYPILLSVNELAQLSGFSVHTIRDWCEQGLLPAKKIGNRWRIDRDAVILALANLNEKRRRKRSAQNKT